ncbi:hypothetical protein KKB18_00055, partial [bacterium]|nr:hypothetical protein [bacterium]
KFKDGKRGSMEFDTVLLAQAVGISIIGYLWHSFFSNKEKECVFYMLITLSSIIGKIVDRTQTKKEIEASNLSES